jgi:hypothetical protein
MSEEDKNHYEVIRKIVQDELKPIEKNMNSFFIVALAVFGFMFITQFVVYKEVQIKANKSETISKLEYYQIELDEHRMSLEAFAFPTNATYIYDQINDNIAVSLGLKYTAK